ncbi:MAG: carbohydrate binding family 9 domain-containing protein [Acidobacteria bacterium]|nr:carbohydrate binding family 9 domain-containing protein [Acidobacteriota bacterium]
MLSAIGFSLTRPGEPEPVVVIPRLPEPPALEDFLDMKPASAVARRMACVTRFVQQSPSDGEPASQRTEVYLGYDDLNLYFVFLAFDSEPERVRARLARREQLFQDDLVEIMLDTFNDQRRAYVFMINPLGVQMDALWTEGRRFDSSFDTVWFSRGRVTDQGYVVWVSIPFKSLRFPFRDQQQWGIIFNRAIPRSNENLFWPYVSSRIEGRLNQAASLIGLENISPGRNIQFIPYGVFRSYRLLTEDDDGRAEWQSDWADADVGLDAKLVFNDSLVLDVAANPDFSQIESDAPQVTVNRRFEVFFPEKRPFFLENKGYFETPLNLVFTRRIADPRVGVRLTGKHGPYSIGMMVADDQSLGQTLGAEETGYGKTAWYGIFRFSRDISEQSTIGAIYTHREFAGSYNRVGGVDGRVKLSQNWITSFQMAYGATRDTDGTHSRGPAYYWRLNREGRQFDYHFEYTDISPGFYSQPGFIYRNDIRRLEQNVDYEFRPEGEFLISWGPEIWTDYTWDHQGIRLDYTVAPSLRFNFIGQTWISVQQRFGRERLRPQDFETLVTTRDYPGTSTRVSFRSEFFQKFTFNGYYRWGEATNFVPVEGAAPYTADQSQGQLNVTLLPVTPLRIDNTYIFSRLKERAWDANIFNNHIFRSRWNWQFTHDISLRVILQYSTTLSNPDFTSLDTSKSFNADFLFTYMPHPGTALYVGFNSNARNLDVVPGEDGFPMVIRTPDRFLNDSRQFFIKLSYLFRL